MIANYHTHTTRCGHAEGTEEEYVLAAIQRGIKQLGFADHAPYCFPDGYYSGFRMKRDRLADYASTVLELREKYKAQIDIRLGVEMEYYPAFFAQTVDMLRDHQVEYFILGQHFLGNEIGDLSAFTLREDEETLIRWYTQLKDAINTGKFSYIAHPDVFRFAGDPAIYRKHTRLLCREANACQVPLEINLLGLFENRHYPNPLFWEVAAEEGCKAVLGCDAHRKEALLDTDVEKRAIEMAEKFGITILPMVELRKI